MKQIIKVMAFVLLLLMLFISQPMSGELPGPLSILDIGDDHPWGGDNSGDDGSPVAKERNGDTQFFYSGFTIIDITINFLILDTRDISYYESTSTLDQRETDFNTRSTRYSSKFER